MCVFVSFKDVCYSFPTSCCSTLTLSTASPPLSSPPASPRSTVPGCVGETSWALQWMFDRQEDNCTKGYISAGSLTKYVFILSKYNASDLEPFKDITISVWVWTRQKLFGFKPAQALERGAYTLRVLVVFHWRLLSEDKKRDSVWHLFHPFAFQTIKWFSLSLLFPLPYLVQPSIHKHRVLQKSIFPPLSFSLVNPPLPSTFQYLNSMPRYNQASTPHPQVTMSANPPHHCASCHWYHDDCWGSEKAHAQQWPITPSVSGLYSLFMFYWNRHNEY